MNGDRRGVLHPSPPCTSEPLTHTLPKEHNREEHDSLCYEVATAYVSASRKIEQLPDPLIQEGKTRATTKLQEEAGPLRRADLQLRSRDVTMNSNNGT